MLKEAVIHLDRIRQGRAEEEDADLDTSEASDPHSSKSKNQDESENARSDDQKTKSAKTAPARDTTAVSNATGVSKSTSNQGLGSSSNAPGDTNRQQGDVVPKTSSVHDEKQKPASESHKDWFSRVTKEAQEVLWPLVSSGQSPTLLTGMQPSDLKSLETFKWEDRLETADLEKHSNYLRGRHFVALPHPLEATAWENGFVPETHGLPSEELEPRMLPLLPQLSHMVSAPRQPVTAGNALLTRFDANVRPYWLRDWQSGFGGYTKVYEHQWEDETRRMYSVAYVVRPRTPTTEACLCFSLMRDLPTSKPWKRPTGQKDPSRSILLDLKPSLNWQLPATVLQRSYG